MPAQIIFNQVGLSAGTPGAREDGLATGAHITVTNGSGQPCDVEILSVDPDDIGSLASLARETPTRWGFDPTANVGESILVRLIEGDTVDEKVFGIKLPASQLLIPAFNEKGDPTVTYASTEGSKNLAITRTHNDVGLGGIKWLGWWKWVRAISRKVEQFSIANYEKSGESSTDNHSANIDYVSIGFCVVVRFSTYIEISVSGSLGTNANNNALFTLNVPNIGATGKTVTSSFANMNVRKDVAAKTEFYVTPLTTSVVGDGVEVGMSVGRTLFEAADTISFLARIQVFTN